MSRFPKLSETFILREMNVLQEFGWNISVYPLILERAEVIHEEANPWLKRLNHFPLLSMDIFLSNMREMVLYPRRYLSLWLTVIRENIGSPKFLIRAVVLLPKTIRMAEHMKRNGIEHIHAHYATHPALVAWVINKISGISYSVTVHAHDIFVDRSMLETKLRDATFIVAISKFNREFMIRHVGKWISEKTYVVHCGIVLQEYFQGNNGKVNDGKFRIISVGSLQPYKGMKYLIEACAILVERGLPVSCKIIGGGEEYAALNALINKLSLSSHVELVGAKTQKEVAKMLQDAHCYTQPSVITPSGKMEGIPVALMEALAAKLPVVASELSGIPELVRHNKTGYLVPPANAKALADALVYVYEHLDSSRKLAESGWELVRTEFELKSNVAQLTNLFSEKLNNA